MLAQLCNLLLRLVYLSAMPLGVLQGMSLDVRSVTYSKLLRQAAAQAARLLECADRLRVIAQVRCRQ